MEMVYCKEIAPLPRFMMSRRKKKFPIQIDSINWSFSKNENTFFPFFLFLHLRYIKTFHPFIVICYVIEKKRNFSNSFVEFVLAFLWWNIEIYLALNFFYISTGYPFVAVIFVCFACRFFSLFSSGIHFTALTLLH